MQTYLNAIFSIFQNIFSVITWRDGFDVLIVSVFLYLIILLFKRTNSFFIIDGIIILFISYLGSRFLNLNLTSTLLQYFFGFFIVIMVVIFRDELRSFFESISFWGLLHRPEISEKRGEEKILDVILKSLDYLSHKKIGALLVFPGNQPIERLLQGGIKLEGILSTSLLLSIFDPTSPGHDGAVYITGGRVARFGVHLPLAEKYEKLGEMGTRHRAAVGLSESSDAFVLVVSEERGSISLARYGVLTKLKNSEEAVRRLKEFFGELSLFRHGKKSFFSFFRNIPEKLFVLGLAIFLWVSIVFQQGHITKEFMAPIEFRFLPNDTQIVKVNPTEVSITISGKSTDFDFFDEKKLRIAIDASSFDVGSNRIKLEDRMIQIPKKLDIVDFSPSTIRFTVEKKENSDNSPFSENNL